MHFPYQFVVKPEPSVGPVPYGALRSKSQLPPAPTNDFDPAELARRLEIHQLKTKRDQKERQQRRQQRAEQRAAEAKRISIQIPEDHGSRRSSRLIIASAELRRSSSGRRRVNGRPSLSRSSSMSSRASFTRRRRSKAWPGPRAQDNSRQVVPEATMFNNIQLNHLGHSIARPYKIYTNEAFFGRSTPISMNIAGNRNSLVISSRDYTRSMVNMNDPILTRSTGERDRNPTKSTGANGGRDNGHAGGKDRSRTKKAEERERSEKEKGQPTKLRPIKSSTPRRIKSAEVLASPTRLESTREENEPAETRLGTRSGKLHQKQHDKTPPTKPATPVGVPVSPKDGLALEMDTKPRSKSCGNLPSNQTDETMERRLSDEKADKSGPLRRSRWTKFAEMNFFSRKEASRIKAGSKTPANTPPKTPSKVPCPDGEGKRSISRQKSLLMLFRKEPS